IEHYNKIGTKDHELKNEKKVNGIQKIAFKKAQKKISKKAAKGAKSQLVALILVLLVGVLGVHRFYLGYIWQGVLQLITFGGLGIWALVDLIRIVTGDLKPKNGEYTDTL
ncbi:MAG TPA: TM2 domain-containing protein, partial [Chitinophagaceae bacterium]|nr:TM2 domain-containing protein [Chitinophagaceae bacterium]